jgi:hypothetical protein
MVLAGFNWFITCVAVGFCVQNNVSVIRPDLQLQEWLYNKMECNRLQAK